MLEALVVVVGGLVFATWTVFRSMDRLERRVSALEEQLIAALQKQHIPAYEWDENIDPPKL